jgi:hypothetical protein
MDDIKEKLYESIEKNGRTSPITIELSQKLDVYIAMEQKEFYGNY